MSIEEDNLPHALSAQELRHVLVVDDDTFAQQAVCEALHSLCPISSHTADDGVVALRMMRSGNVTPDILICDIYMPNMDGLEFLGRLAEMQYKGAVVLLSGVNMDMLDMARQIAKTNGLNVVGAFPKPVSRSQLAMALGLESDV